MFLSLRTFLHLVVVWLLLLMAIPFVFILFFARYWRESSRKPLEYWERPMLVAIVGFFMLLSIAPAPDYPRMTASALPALILLGWFLDSPRKLARALVVALSVGTLLMALFEVAKSGPTPWTSSRPPRVNLHSSIESSIRSTFGFSNIRGRRSIFIRRLTQTFTST